MSKNFEVDVKEGKNDGLMIVFCNFFGSVILGGVEWWFKNGMPLPSQVMAEQTGALLDRILNNPSRFQKN